MIHHHLAVATIQVANLVNYNCHPKEDGDKLLLRSAVAGRIYKLCAKNTSNSGLTEPLCRAQASFYALPNNERGTKYRGLTYSARQNCP